MLLLLACCVGASMFAPRVDGAVVSGLYEAVVRPADRSRDAAFVEALRQVAVRVTGSRDAAERLLASNPNPARYVTKFSYQSDGAAAVAFDATAFDRLLTEAALPIWGRERPAVAVWLAAADPSGRLTWKNSLEMPAEREAIERTAQARGVPIVWPFMDAADVAGASAALAAPTYEGLMQTSARYRADAVLVGVVARDGAVRWSFAFNNSVTDRTTTIEEGIHMAADRCAQLLAIAPGALSVIALQVTGIQDLDAYARVLTYLEGLTLVAAGGVSVEQLRGEELDLRLKVRGDAEALRRTLALGRRLVETNAGDAAVGGRLVYRLMQ